MVFSSMIFIWAFLPVVFILDKIAGLPGRKGRLLRKNVPQNILLLLASLLFYAWGQPDYLWLLLVSILANYLLGFLMASRRGALSAKTGRLILLIAGIAVNLGILGYYKYFNFFANTLNRVLGRQLLEMRQIALPLGVSFFTFQALTYLVDLYKEKIPAEKNILNMALYFSFFPKITQGPIEKYRDFGPQLAGRRQNLQKTGEGIRRFIYGLAKKVLIADVLGACVDAIYGFEIGNVNGSFAWIAALFYSLQLYYDFSGYSDMAVGLGKMFGFTICENFNYPYLSGSIQEFWRRWHISLSSWFRDYLYIPLGGNRKGKLRTYVNLGIVFLATGLWHGATSAFLVWGMFHGFFIIIERIGLKKVLERIGFVRYLYTELVVVFGWVLFRVANLGPALQYIKRMLTPWNDTSGAMALQELMSNRCMAAVIAGVLGMGLVQAALKKFCPSVEKLKGSLAEMLWCLILAAASMLLLINGTYNPAIYLNF